MKQAGKIIKFSKTTVKNYWGKPKNCTLVALIQKKSPIIEPSSKLLLLFSQIRGKKEKRLFLMKLFLMIKKYSQFLITFFQTSQTWNCLTIVIIFPQKARILSQLSLKRLKNTSVFLILKKEILMRFFTFRKITQEEVSKVIRYLKTKKKLSDEWFFHQSLQTF